MYIIYVLCTYVLLVQTILHVELVCMYLCFHVRSAQVRELYFFFSRCAAFILRTHHAHNEHARPANRPATRTLCCGVRAFARAEERLNAANAQQEGSLFQSLKPFGPIDHYYTHRACPVVVVIVAFVVFKLS